MSVQRRFSRQYDKWLLRCHATGEDKRWPEAMAPALARLKELLDKQNDQR